VTQDDGQASLSSITKTSPGWDVTAMCGGLPLPLLRWSFWTCPTRKVALLCVAGGAPLLVYTRHRHDGPNLSAVSMMATTALAGVEAQAGADAQPASPAASPAGAAAQSSALATTTLSASNEAQSTPPAASFINRMTKRLDGVGIRPPQVSKRRVKSLPPGTTRRSHRIAGFGVEQQQRPIQGSLRSKKALMATLGETSLSAEALDKYAAMFSNPLTTAQVKALADLFGWSLPDEHDVLGGGI
jgi:hypothetical protein